MKKTVLITGTSSGIGGAAAIKFRDEGWNVVATMRRPDHSERTAAFQSAGIEVCRLDVTDRHSVEVAVRTAIDRFGSLDVLVNNAGFGPMGPFETFPVEQMRDVFETNVFGLSTVAQVVIPYFREVGQGRIVNVSSMGGEFTTPYGGVYHASKYAVEALSDAMRFELRPFGIAVSIVQPGPVLTPMAERAADLEIPAKGEPYHQVMAGFAEMTRQQLAAGQGFSRPEKVAETIFAAASVRSPRPRYKVGVTAHALPAMRRLLPTSLWDGMWRSIFARASKLAPAT